MIQLENTEALEDEPTSESIEDENDNMLYSS